METERTNADQIPGRTHSVCNLAGGLSLTFDLFVICLFFQTCDMKLEGRKRFLTLKNVQLDQAGEVSYQALNAVTTAMLTVKGMALTHRMTHTNTLTGGTWQRMVRCVFVCLSITGLIVPTWQSWS